MSKFEDYIKYEMVCFGCSRLGIKNVIFYDEASFQNHYISTHSKNAKSTNLRCPQCNKKSKSWYNFSAHITMHRQHTLPPWICLHSSENIKTHKNTKHIAKNHENNIMKPGVCGKRCSTRFNLINHMNANHNMDISKENKHDQHHKGIEHDKSNTILSPKRRNKKLRPKMKYIPSPQINSRKRARNDMNEIDLNQHDLAEPKQKRFRRDDIKQQINTLLLLHSAAIYVDETNKCQSSLVLSLPSLNSPQTVDSTLSPQSPLI